MVAVRHGFVAAAGAVHVARLVAGARGRAAFGVGVRHGDGMLLHAAFVRVVQMAFLQVVHVAVVADGGVAAEVAPNIVNSASFCIVLNFILPPSDQTTLN